MCVWWGEVLSPGGAAPYSCTTQNHRKLFKFIFKQGIPAAATWKRSLLPLAFGSPPALNPQDRKAGALWCAHTFKKKKTKT